MGVGNLFQNRRAPTPFRSASSAFAAYTTRVSRDDRAVAIAHVGLKARTVQRLGAGTTGAFASTLNAILHGVVHSRDGRGTVGALFPRSSDLFAFIAPEHVSEVLAAVCTAVVEPQACHIVTTFGLGRDDLRLTSVTVPLPLHASATDAFNLVWHHLTAAQDQPDGDWKSAWTLERLSAQGGLGVALQPIVSLEDHGLLGYEALIRGPAHSSYSTPDALFGAAQAAGQLDALEALCRETVLSSAPEAIPEQALLFINVHPRRHLREIAQAVGRTTLPPSRLVLELSEQTVFRDQRRVVDMLNHCRNAGCSVALDDVGTGFTGLPVLTMYAWDYLKLDRSLIVRAAHSQRDRELVGCLVEYAHRTGSQVIAEGIEDDRQLAVCRRMGVRWGQGFYLGAPALLGGSVVPQIIDRRHSPME